MKQFSWPRFASARHTVLMVGGIILLVGGSIAWWNRTATDPEAQTQPVSQTTDTAAGPKVTLTTAELKPVPQTLAATGTVQAVELIPVNSQLSGRQIVRVLVDVGAVVQAGQTLATLDSTQLRAELAQAQARVAEAEANLAELQAGSRTEEINRAQAAVTSAEATVAQAQADLTLASERVQQNQTLIDEQVITRDRFNDLLTQETRAQATVDQAKASLIEAKERLKEIAAGPRQEVISQARARLKQAQAQVQSLMAQLNDTQIVAPRAGKIAERHASVGAIATTSAPLFTIIQNSNLELALQVPETQLTDVRPGQKVSVTAEPADVRLTGTVQDIEPVVDAESRQATVNVTLPPHRLLKPGMFLRGQIITSSTPGVVIPAMAVLPQTDGSMQVWVASTSETAIARTVIVGELLPDEQIEIIEGLSPGDRVVVKGASYLQAGDPFEVVDEDFVMPLDS